MESDDDAPLLPGKAFPARPSLDLFDACRHPPVRIVGAGYRQDAGNVLH
jgi:hypothetical protein